LDVQLHSAGMILLFSLQARTCEQPLPSTFQASMAQVQPVSDSILGDYFKDAMQIKVNQDAQHEPCLFFLIHQLSLHL